jgi:hypothetical protein
MRKGSGKAGWTREEYHHYQHQQQQLYGPVPITPGWVPELTPTWWGGDLVLNVR